MYPSRGCILAIVILLRCEDSTTLRPDITPKASEIIKNEGDPLEIICTGTKKLFFVYPNESGELLNTSTPSIKENPDDGGSYRYEFRRPETVHGDTGWYGCADHTVEVTHDFYFDPDISWVYVYVQSNTSLFVEQDNFVSLREHIGGTVTIPCRPTSPNLTVQFVSDETILEPSDRRSFDPRFGFTLRNLTLGDTGYFKCVIEQNSTYNEVNYHLYVLQRKMLNEPKILEDTLNNVTSGQTLRVKCTIDVEANMHYVLHWKTPQNVLTDNRISTHATSTEHGANIQRATTELVIEGVLDTDEGLYECVIKTFHDTKKSEKYIKVHDSTTLRPDITPKASEIIKNEGDPLEIICTGTKKLFFVYPNESGELLNTSTPSIKENPDDGGSYRYEFRRPETVHGDTGWYGCADHTVEVTHDSYFDPNISWVYVYVQSNTSLFVEQDNFVSLREHIGGTVTIPCRPTSPNLTVQFVSDETILEPSDRRSFDPRFGFTLRNLTLGDTGYFKCVIEQNSTYNEVNYHLYVLRRKMLNEPKILEDTLNNVTSGQTLRVKCTIDVEANMHYVLHWKTPQNVLTDNRISTHATSTEHGANIQRATTELVIEGVLDTDEGLYECVIKTFHDTKKSEKYIKVHDSTTLRPDITPKASEIIKNEGDPLEIICTGTKKLFFVYPNESGELLNTSTPSIKENPDDGGSYRYEFRRPETVHGDTGWYGCADHTVEVTHDSYFDPNISWVYVYVQSNTSLFVEQDNFVSLREHIGGTVTIPCRPTSPNLTVQFVSDETILEPSDRRSFDPRFGFTLRNLTLGDTGYFKCVIEQNSTYNEVNYHLYVLRRKMLNEPKILEDTLNNVTSGQTLRVKCTIDVEANMHYVLHWKTPQNVLTDNRISTHATSTEHGANIQRATTELVIEGVLDTDEGLYECVIKTFHDTKKSEKYIKVHDSTTLRPDITPKASEIIKNEGDPLEIICTGTKKLFFVYPNESGELLNTSTPSIKENPDDGGSYRYEFRRPETVHGDTGWYGCADHTVEVTHDSYFDPNISWVYVYVQSNTSLFVEQDNFVSLREHIGGTVTIPCRPTSPNLTVQFVSDETILEPSDRRSFDPRFGFTLRNLTLGDTGYFKCVIEQNSTYNEVNYHLYVLQRKMLNEPKILEDTLNNVTSGQTLRVMCTIDVEANMHYVLHWKTPQNVLTDNRISTHATSTEHGANIQRATTELVIEGVLDTDEGLYECVIKTFHDTKKSEKYIKVHGN